MNNYKSHATPAHKQPTLAFTLEQLLLNAALELEGIANKNPYSCTIDFRKVTVDPTFNKSQSSIEQYFKSLRYDDYMDACAASCRFNALWTFEHEAERIGITLDSLELKIVDMIYAKTIRFEDTSVVKKPMSNRGAWAVIRSVAQSATAIKASGLALA